MYMIDQSQRQGKGRQLLHLQYVIMLSHSTTEAESGAVRMCCAWVRVWVRAWVRSGCGSGRGSGSLAALE